MYDEPIQNLEVQGMKLQVHANDQMVEKLDKYAEMMSVSRSALCGMLIGQGLMGLDKACGILDGVGERIGDAMVIEKAMSDMGKEVAEIG